MYFFLLHSVHCPHIVSPSMKGNHWRSEEKVCKWSGRPHSGPDAVGQVKHTFSIPFVHWFENRASGTNRIGLGSVDDYKHGRGGRKS